MKANIGDKRKAKDRFDFAAKEYLPRMEGSDPRLMPYHVKSGIEFERNYQRHPDHQDKAEEYR